MGQRSLIGAKLEEMYAKQAAARKSAEAKGNRNAAKDKTIVRNSAPSSTPAPKARDQAAKAVGTTGQNINKAKVVLAKPELTEKVEAGTMSLDGAYKKAKAPVATAAPSKQLTKQEARALTDKINEAYNKTLDTVAAIVPTGTDPEQVLGRIIGMLANAADIVQFKDGFWISADQLLISLATFRPELADKVDAGEFELWKAIQLCIEETATD